MLRHIVFLLITPLMGVFAQSPELSGLVGLRVEESYRKLLSAMPLQLEVGGAKIFKFEDGSMWLVSVGSTVAKTLSPSEELRRRTVAKAKAQANAIAELNGTKVKATTMMTTIDKITIKDGVESGLTEEVLTETIVTNASGVINQAPVVASWMNVDQTTYFLAIGKRLK